MNLTIGDKDTIVRRATEEAYPYEVREMLNEDINKKWKTFVKNLAPKAPENLLHTISIIIYGKGRRNKAISFEGKYISMPYLKYTSSNWVLDIDACPDAEMKMSVKLFFDFLNDEETYRNLVKSVLVNINTDTKLKELHPNLYRLIRDDYNSYNTLVQVDMESIEISLDDSSVEVSDVAV